LQRSLFEDLGREGFVSTRVNNRPFSMA